MLIFKVSIITILAASSALAVPFYPVTNLGVKGERPWNTTSTSEIGTPSAQPNIEGREVKTMKGKCAGEGEVKVNLKNYRCWNSHCSDRNVTDSVKVTLARKEDGKFVAKCPMNDLSYDWQWPDGKPAPWEQGK